MTSPWGPATGIGSLPGTDPAEAVRLVLGELPDFAHLPELPARGATASITGRAVAVVAGLGFDLQPAGWRLTDAPGVDHRRARSLLAQDLDAVEELEQRFVPLQLVLVESGGDNLTMTFSRGLVDVQL